MRKILEIVGLIFGTLFIFKWVNSYALGKGLHIFGWEKIMEVFVTLFKFSLSLGFILLVYWIIWNPIYKWFDRSYKLKGGKWEELTNTQKLWYSLALFGLLILLFGMLS